VLCFDTSTPASQSPALLILVLQLDGDMYESTMDGIVNLYPKLSKGGFLIVDDWAAGKACQDAIIDYSAEYNITEEIIPIDWAGCIGGKGISYLFLP